MTSTAGDIKAKIIDFLADEIGTWSDGVNSVPAIAVVPPEVSGDLNPSGLEVIIERIPNVSGMKMSGGQTLTKAEWKMYLVQYESGSQTLDKAIRKCLANLPNPQARRVKADHPIIAQVAVIFTDWAVLTKDG